MNAVMVVIVVVYVIGGEWRGLAGIDLEGVVVVVVACMDRTQI
jgi:hypothetical protein